MPDEQGTSRYPAGYYEVTGDEAPEFFGYGLESDGAERVSSKEFENAVREGGVQVREYGDYDI